jgi:hypothetical protein
VTVLSKLGWLETEHSLHGERVRAIRDVLQCSIEDAKTILGLLTSTPLLFRCCYLSPPTSFLFSNQARAYAQHGIVADRRSTDTQLAAIGPASLRIAWGASP